MRFIWLLATALAVAGCKGKDGDGGAGTDTGAPSTDLAGPGCGDGVLTPPEQCDDGPGNSDTDPGACRTDCQLAHCGDGVQDAGEGCDDGDRWGGDGCLPDCTVEQGPFEDEPNDNVGQGLPNGGEIAGSLTAFDRDCFTFTVPNNGWVSAEILPQGDKCNELAVIELVDNELDTLSAGWPDLTTGCAQLTPDADDARYMSAGTYGICVQGLFNAEVVSYRLAVTVGDDSCNIPGPDPAPENDLDGDGLADECDDDDDGDGINDAADNCPRTSNGPNTRSLRVNDNGYIMTWLLLAPMPAVPSSDQCLPDAYDLLGDDATAVPRLGDQDNGYTWIAFTDAGDRMDFDDTFAAYQPAPRELYAVSYVYSDTARNVDLYMGFDDGMRMWFNNVYVDEMNNCQGASSDQYSYPVSLLAGWNQITVRLYDGGGGWAMYARFRDETGIVMTDVPISISPDGQTIFDQSDIDGDGIGDACDYNL